MTRVTTVVALACIGWVVVQLVAPVGPRIVGWLPQALCPLLTAVACIRTGRVAGLPQATRRFWWQVGVALLFLTVGVASQTRTVFAHGYRPYVPDPTALTCYGLLVVAFVTALFFLPLGTHSRAQRIRLWLDISTVMLAAGVFLWHLTAGLLMTTGVFTLGVLLLVVGIEAAALTAVLAVVKVILTGSASVDRGALRLLGAAAGMGALLSSLEPLFNAASLRSQLLVIPATCLLDVWAARRQRLAAVRGDGDAAPGRGRRRRYSLMPYVAVAGTDALLLAVAVQANTVERLVVAVAVVGLTALVVARQLIAFRENDYLLTRLDAGMEELALHERRFRSLVQNSSDIIMITDLSGTISYLSPGVERVLGHAPDHLIGRRPLAAVHPDDRPAVREHLERIAAEPGAVTVYQIRLAHRDRSWRWIEVTSTNLLDDPSVGGIVSNARDITAAREYQERLNHEATHDPLTGLANRALFNRRIHDCFANTDLNHPVSVILIDLDDFKPVNDTHGHAAGDALLVAVAERLRHSVRAQDTVSRLGGDEFAILLDDLDPAEADTVVDRITEVLAEPVPFNGQRLLIRASFGIVSGCAGDDPATLLHQADMAMYDAKAQGGGACTRYTPGMEALRERRRAKVR